MRVNENLSSEPILNLRAGQNSWSKQEKEKGDGAQRGTAMKYGGECSRKLHTHT